MKRKLLILASTIMTLAIPAMATPNTEVIYESRSWVAGTRQTQQFADYLTLKPGQEKLKLTLVFNNGKGLTPGYSYLKVYLANKLILTEADFHDRTSVSLDMTNKLGRGSTPINFMGIGVPGSTFSFHVIAPLMVRLNSARPDKTAPKARLTLYGTNFSSKPSEDTVSFGGITVEPNEASPTSLGILVPDNAQAGDNKVTVSVRGVMSNAITVKVQPKPEVTGVSLFSGPPGSPLTITGKNFSPVAGENTVYFGGMSSSVTSANTTSLTTTIPMGLDPQQPQWDIKVNVETNGVKSDSNVTVNVQNRYINEGEVSPVGPRD